MRNLLNGKINNNEFNMFVMPETLSLTLSKKKIQHDCYMMLMWNGDLILSSCPVNIIRNTIYGRSITYGISRVSYIPSEKWMVWNVTFLRMHTNASPIDVTFPTYPRAFDQSLFVIQISCYSKFYNYISYNSTNFNLRN